MMLRRSCGRLDSSIRSMRVAQSQTSGAYIAHGSSRARLYGDPLQRERRAMDLGSFLAELYGHSRRCVAGGRNGGYASGRHGCEGASADAGPGGAPWPRSRSGRDSWRSCPTPAADPEPRPSAGVPTPCASRIVEIGGPEYADLDPSSVVLGLHEQQPLEPPAIRIRTTIVWQGSVASDRSGRSSSYYVRLYCDGAGHCSCPDYYYRGLLRRQPAFRCKHLVRAWVAHNPSDITGAQGSS